tara:strand:- start:1750 stop:2088 length:339 start_codon:yes stop_codon:yes gene_type:complete
MDPSSGMDKGHKGGGDMNTIEKTTKIMEGDEEIFSVEPGDCLIVFREAGHMEAFIPHHEEEEAVSEAAAAVLMIGVLFSEGPGPERMRNTLMEFATSFEPDEEPPGSGQKPN